MAFRDLVPWTFGKKDVPLKRGADNPFDRLHNEIDTLFDNFFRGFSREPFLESRLGGFSPSIDVSENDSEIKVAAELPGMDEEDIEVSLNGESLTIRGEKKEEKEDRGKDYYRMERSYGSFSRTIPMHMEIDPDKVKAKFRKGILSITLPKTKKAVEDTKKIPVKVG